LGFNDYKDSLEKYNTNIFINPFIRKEKENFDSDDNIHEGSLWKQNSVVIDFVDFEPDSEFPEDFELYFKQRNLIFYKFLF
jgi:hypothetical protein